MNMATMAMALATAVFEEEGEEQHSKGEAITLVTPALLHHHHHHNDQIIIAAA
jgi:hypothetical protein